MADQRSLAEVALVISLLGLGIALTQLLQALFNSADGFRRCQQTVIGQWYNYVRLNWRWSGFRYETVFATPTFTLKEVDEHQRFLWQVEDDARHYRHRFAPLHTFILWLKSVPMSRHGDMIVITGTQQSRRQTLTERDIASEDPLRYPELVGWLSLLESLHRKQEALLRESRDNLVPPDIRVTGKLDNILNSTSSEVAPAPLPARPRWTNFAIRLREQSWDFMPPDIVRPLARSTLGDIMVIAHRLNMRWVTIDPHSGDGGMRAEGPDHNISSMKIRSLGIVLQFSYNHGVGAVDQRINLSDSVIPSIAADKMGFGILPGCKELNIRDFPLIADNDKSMELIESMLRTLDVTDSAFKTLANPASRDEFSRAPGIEVLQGVNDAIAMLASFLPLQSSYIAKVRHPLRHGVAFVRVCLYIETKRVLIKILESYGEDKLSSGLRLVLANLKELQIRGFPFSRNIETKEQAEIMNTCRSAFQAATTCLKALQSEYCPEPEVESNKEAKADIQREKGSPVPYWEARERFYLDLVGAHVSVNANSVSVALKNVREKRWRSDGRGSPGPPWQHEVAHVYVDNVPEFLNILESKGYKNRDRLRDAWWLLMLRGCVWELSVHMMPWQPPPSQYYSSPMPVYIS